MAEHSRYQQNIIKNFYENRESISLQRSQELVTELYLSEGKKRKKYWDQLAKHLEKLGVKPCLLYTSPSPRDATLSRMPSSA